MGQAKLRQNRRTVTRSENADLRLGGAAPVVSVRELHPQAQETHKL
jgi:hypothetical protein